jgi:hypothetical protein
MLLIPVRRREAAALYVRGKPSRALLRRGSAAERHAVVKATAVRRAKEQRMQTSEDGAERGPHHHTGELPGNVLT